MMPGHYAYFGITGNFYSLVNFHEVARKTWRRWLSRRSCGRSMPWPDFVRLEKRYGLPRARVVHSTLSNAANS
jgi:RNA-directed DNA polymerase